MNDQQIRLFREIRILFRGVASSLANSAGIFLGGTAHCDLVRPGIALFGGNPMPGQAKPHAPGGRAEGPHHAGAPVKKGDTVGYGASWTAARPSRVAIVAAGYGDGYFRAAAAGKGKAPANVIIAGKPCPLVGRISMDLLAVDVTDLPGSGARRGEFATLIGGGIDVDEFGAACGTIGYEVLTNLGRRYHRDWIGA